MSKVTPENKQVKHPDVSTGSGDAPADSDKPKTADERALALAEEQAKDELRKGCVWVTYVGVKPELAQTSVMVPAQGRNLRFFRGIRKAVPKTFADKLTDSNAAFKQEG